LHFVIDEGEYVCQRCTIFGLEKYEVEALIKLGFKMTDHNTDDEGYEVESSIFKLMRELGRELEFEPNGDAICTDAPGERKTILYTLTKEL